jgi:septal ring factor EnvC (AmiA/AmiB activator)
MVDNFVAELKKEQVADEEKKTYCEAQFEESEGKKKALVREISDLETNMADAKEAIAALAQEIDSLAAGIRSLDKQVAEGTEQRKEQASDYTALIASNSAAKQLLEFAKNRLNKFYNPKLYKPEGKPEDEPALFLQKGAPPPPPETVKAFSKKSGESSGVIQMIDLLINDIVKETVEAETIEKNAQEDYEQMLADAAEKRAEDAKSLTDKEAVRTELEQSLQEYGAGHKVASTGLMATERYISNLHGECDFLLKYFDVRKEARSGEIDSLNKCKAVLSGADYE